MKYRVNTNCLQVPSCYVPSVDSRQTPIKIHLDVKTTDVTQPLQTCEDSYYSQGTEESKASTKQVSEWLEWLQEKWEQETLTNSVARERASVLSLSISWPRHGAERKTGGGANSINGVRFLMTPFQYFSRLLLLTWFQKHA